MFKFLSGIIAVIVAIALFGFFTGYFTAKDDVKDVELSNTIHR
ncbi:MAG: hypothetical protein CFH44_00304 [Proteobacteria bacterium]|jgi:membrane-associated HD superfamily phosphohydrolase|nr:MAG: hypothetical protein CFH44_00304 [Pseudomonadota bacterium]|tara:strand:- start:153 stop:281 length:129 start_codon:yes stop_codon:yes gene_type:complete